MTSKELARSCLLAVGVFGFLPAWAGCSSDSSPRKTADAGSPDGATNMETGGSGGASGGGSKQDAATSHAGGGTSSASGGAGGAGGSDSSAGTAGKTSGADGGGLDGGGGGDGAAGSSATDGGPWGPLPPGAMYQSVAFEDWTTRWAQWSYADTSCDDAMFDTDGSLCNLYQPAGSPVFFFASAADTVERTLCHVPRGKAILLPLTNFILDNGGIDPSMQQTTAELRSGVADVVNSSRDLVLVIDGVTVDNLDQYAVGPIQFSYTLPPVPNFYSCNGLGDVTGTIDPSFVGGVFVLLPPPAVGTHTIEYGGTITYNSMDYVSDVKATFTVE